MELEAGLVTVFRASRGVLDAAEMVAHSYLILARSRHILRKTNNGNGQRPEMELQLELQRLDIADRHIADAERTITKQTMELEKLRRDGHDTKLAEKTLQGFQDALQAMRAHREEIVTTIGRIDRGLI